MQDHEQAQQTHFSMSRRERQIIEFLVVGATAREVANELELSPHTVRTHIRNIYMKLGLANRIELLRWRDSQGPLWNGSPKT